MSLRLRLTLVIVALMALSVGLLAWREINGTRRSVHEEIEAASRVAVQVLRVVNQRPFAEARIMVQGLGRVRARLPWSMPAVKCVPGRGGLPEPRAAWVS